MNVNGTRFGMIVVSDSLSNALMLSFVLNSDQSYFIAETMMPGRSGFDFNGSSQSFNVLASYLFGKVFAMFPLYVRCFLAPLVSLNCRGKFAMFIVGMFACRTQLLGKWK
jgi:hypothetical protein